MEPRLGPFGVGTLVRGIIDGLDSMSNIWDCWDNNDQVTMNLDIFFSVAVARIERQSGLSKMRVIRLRKAN